MAKLRPVAYTPIGGRKSAAARFRAGAARFPEFQEMSIKRWKISTTRRAARRRSVFSSFISLIKSPQSRISAKYPPDTDWFSALCQIKNKLETVKGMGKRASDQHIGNMSIAIPKGSEERFRREARSDSEGKRGAIPPGTAGIESFGRLLQLPVQSVGSAKRHAPEAGY